MHSADAQVYTASGLPSGKPLFLFFKTDPAVTGACV